MTNPYQSPKHVAESQKSPKQPNKKMRRAGQIFVTLGILAPVVGFLVTVCMMIRAFSMLTTSQSAPAPTDLAISLSNAMVVNYVGFGLAVVLLPLGIALLILARRIGH